MFAPNHPRAKSPIAKREVKQDWEKLTARPSSSLTGASCCNRSRTQMPRFLSDSDVKLAGQQTERAESYHSGRAHFEVAAGKSRRVK